MILSTRTFNLLSLLQRLTGSGSTTPEHNSSNAGPSIKEDVIVDLSAYIIKTDEHCVGSGGFGDVYEGVRLDRPSVSGTERRVAIKVIRPSMAHIDSLPKAIKHLKREMAVWQGLVHHNIVPFLGVSYTFGRMPALISLWMENGRLDGYLLTHPDVDRGRIAEGIACGLQYLHSRVPKITHGDVKAANTLVDRAGNPRLCDFGLSRMLSDDSLWMTTTLNSRGSIRWMAPELLDGTESFPTSESDVYAFAMTVLEILTGKIPYHHHRMDGAVLMAVTIRKELPNRPIHIDGSHLWKVGLDELWEFLTKCWQQDPRRRPNIGAAEELFHLGRENWIHGTVDMHAVIPLEPFRGHQGTVNSIVFSPDSKRIASGSDDGTVRVWDARTGDVVATLVEDCMNPFYSVYSVAFSPDGKRIATGSWDMMVRVWDAETGELVLALFEGHTDYVESVAFSPDGKWIASGSWDMTVLVWDAETGEVVSGPFEGHKDYVRSVVFSPDGKRIASGSDDTTVRVWDSATGKVVSGPFDDHTTYVSSVAFSSDGKWIASGSWDMTVLVWDAETGEVVSGPFEGHTGRVRSVAFSPDGKQLASGSDDKTVRVWDTMTGKMLFRPKCGHTDWVFSVAFSPDGKRITSGSRDHTVRVWNAKMGY